MIRQLNTAVRPWLPDGAALPPEDWRRRHRVMTAVLAAHVPAIFGYALLRHVGPAHAVVEALVPGLLLVVALHARQRLVRSLGVALGLISCSAVFVHLSGGLIEWHFHFFVALALVALYQEWRVYLAALLFVVVQHALGSVLSYNAVYNHGSSGDWWWALVHGAFVLAASACHITTWRYHEIAAARAERLRRQLAEGENSLVARLERTAEIRNDLIATASHEFRTPITAITGAATTLLRHDDRLSAGEREQLLSSITGRAERLSQMLESMLIAAQVEVPDPGACTHVSGIVEDVVIARPRPGGLRIDVEVPHDLHVACAQGPLRHVLDRLIQFASHQAGPAPVKVSVRLAEDQVAITVIAPVPPDSGLTLDGLLEPFHGGTHVKPREASVGLGLFAARRIAEAHGGSLDVRLGRGKVLVTAWLPAVVPVPVPRAGDRADAAARRPGG